MNYNIILEKVSIALPHEKYTNPWENQNLEDLFLELPKTKNCLSFQKYAVSKRIVVSIIY